MCQCVSVLYPGKVFIGGEEAQQRLDLVKAQHLLPLA